MVTIIVVRMNMLDGCSPDVTVPGHGRPSHTIWGMIFVHRIRMILYPLRIVVVPIIVMPIIWIVPLIVPVPSAGFIPLSGI